MKISVKKRGQKIIKKLSRVGQKTATASKQHVKTHIFERFSNIRSVRLWVLEWLLLVTVVILFAVIQSIWYRNSYESEVFVAGGTYSEGSLGAVNTMNPLYAATNSEKILAKLMFSSLLAADTSGHLGNSLARNVTVDETGKIWTVTMKTSARWSDGQPITAADVVFTTDLLKDPAAKTTLATNFTNIKIETPNDHTVVFTTPTIYAAFTETLDFPILPKHILGSVEPSLIYENAFSTTPIGSGPFTLNALQKAATGQTVYLNRNETYFAGPTNLASFTLRTYTTPEEITTALNRAEITATADIPADLNQTEPAAITYTRETPLNSGVFAFLNTSSPILSNQKIRQAIQRGIDLSAIRQGIAEEDQYLNFPILSRQMPSLTFPAFPDRDTEQAAKLISEANHKLIAETDDSQPATLTIAVLSTGTLPEIATRLADQLATLGFQTTVEEFVAAEATQDFFTAVVRPRSYDILIYEIDLGLDADPFAYFDSANITETGMNLSNYENPIVDDLLLSARTTLDGQLRKAKYESFLRYWLNDVPAIGIYQSTLSYHYAKNTRIFSENNTITHPLDRFADVTNWATEKSSRNRTP